LIWWSPLIEYFFGSPHSSLFSISCFNICSRLKPSKALISGSLLRSDKSSRMQIWWILQFSILPMGHLFRSLESGVSSFETQELHIGISFDDFLLSCVGFCKPMVSIIKDKIEFSSECFYFKRLVNQITLFLRDGPFDFWWGVGLDFQFARYFFPPPDTVRFFVVSQRTCTIFFCMNVYTFISFLFLHLLVYNR
jgi:hypothetical protein